MLFKEKEMLMLKPHHFRSGNLVSHMAFKDKNGMIMVGVDWCGYCKALKPTWKEYRRIANDFFTVAAVDAVEYPKLAKKLKVDSFPTLFLVENGKLKPYTEEDRSLFNLVQIMCDLSKHPRCKNHPKEKKK